MTRWRGRMCWPMPMRSASSTGGAWGGRDDVRGHRSSRAGAMAGRHSGGAAHGDVPPAAGAAGADSEAGGRGAATGDSGDPGSGGANRGPADLAADLRSGFGAHGLWLSTGPNGAGGGSGGAPGVAGGAYRGDRR